jgi:hypothetical protein
VTLHPKSTASRLAALAVLAASLSVAAPPSAAQSAGLDMSSWIKVDKIPKTEATVIQVQVRMKESGPERIDQAGKLKMLTQRIPASACNAAAGVGGQVAKGFLAASIGEFDRIVTALEHGDVYISIRDAETDRGVLRRIDQVNEVWGPVREEVLPMADLSSQATTVEEVATTAEAAPQLLDLTEALIGDLIGEYADPSRLLATDAVGLDIVGRQRMMPQIISKTACMIAEGIDTATARAELDASVGLFELSLDALVDGMPEAGVRPPPTPEIRDELTAVIEIWDGVRPTIDDLKAEGSLPVEDRELVYATMNDLTSMLNEVARKYALASTQNL